METRVLLNVCCRARFVFYLLTFFFASFIKEILKSRNIRRYVRHSVFTLAVMFSLSIRGKQVLCAVVQIVSRHSNSRPFSVMPEIRETQIAECGCHIG